MKRLLTTGLALCTLILPCAAFAADKPTGPYVAPDALSLQADSGKTNVASSDLLTDVTRVDLVVRLNCAEANCATAAFGLSIDGQADDAAALTFSAGADGHLVSSLTKVAGNGQGGEQAFRLTATPGDSFELRIHWNNGDRVTFDLYGRDPVSGMSAMESHDVQLAGDIKQLSMRVSGGEMILEKQTYTFR